MRREERENWNPGRFDAASFSSVGELDGPLIATPSPFSDKEMS